MGYCTLYGDMAGGLSVISDVTKQQVYALGAMAQSTQRDHPQTIIDKIPSAELKAQSKRHRFASRLSRSSTRFFKSYVEEFLSPEEIASKHNLPLDQVIDLIHRIHRAEYKRRQSAPGIRVSKKAFRVGRRYPIVQGWV